LLLCHTMQRTLQIKYFCLFQNVLIRKEAPKRFSTPRSLFSVAHFCSVEIFKRPVRINSRVEFLQTTKLHRDSFSIKESVLRLGKKLFVPCPYVSRSQYVTLTLHVLNKDLLLRFLTKETP